jgi:hypothetical protein
LSDGQCEQLELDAYASGARRRPDSLPVTCLASSIRYPLHLMCAPSQLRFSVQ